jgi:hypothetical protein
MNPVHTFPLYFHKIHSNIIFLYVSGFQMAWSLFTFSIVCISRLSHACYMPRPSHPA